jgi:hypothetical protein
MYLGDSKSKTDVKLIALVEEKTDFADPTPEELEASKKQD